ncbi:MAG: UbiD family decarboxylase [Acidobacteriota bacterium]|nr:UbiD family decarboxylase [Acidobacteriota bacterium]
MSTSPENKTATLLENLKEGQKNFKDLRSFAQQVIDHLPGTIKQVNHTVNPRFGCTALAEKFARKNEYPALFFPRIRGSRLPLIINLMSTYERLALALETTPLDMVTTYGNRLAKGVTPIEVTSEEAPVKEIIWQGKDADLTRLPIPVHNADDAGPFITGGVGITRDLETGELNAGLYRHQVFDKQELGVWFIATHHGAYIHRAYEEQNKPLPIAIAIGHHPAFLMGVISRLHGIGGELEAAGALLEEPVRLVKAETSNLLVPADAEIVIEGEVVPKLRREEGPFGEWPGHYMAGGPKPIIRVSTITLRSDAIYQDIFSANQEHLVIGSLPRMGSIYRAVKAVVPGVHSVNVPAHSRMHCYISLKKSRDTEVKKAAFAALNTEPENLKMIVVVDSDINVFNDGDVMWAIGTRFDAAKDLLVIPDWSGPGGLLPTGWKYHEDGTRSPKTMAAMVLDATKPEARIPYPKRAKVPEPEVDTANIEKISDLTTLNIDGS